MIERFIAVGKRRWLGIPFGEINLEFNEVYNLQLLCNLTTFRWTRDIVNQMIIFLLYIGLKNVEMRGYDAQG